MKTKNYIGRHDENRGIILFCLVFAVLLAIVFGITLAVKSNSKENKGISEADDILSLVEKQFCDINKFEINENNLIIEGKIKSDLPETIITKMQNVQIILKDSTGDKYEFNTDYYISTENISFSSTLENGANSFNLDSIKSGKYYVLVRIKYESSKAEEGYRYRYYTLKNITNNNNLDYGNMKIYFDSTEQSLNYLTIENK